MCLIRNNWERGARFLGSDYPVLCGAMSWISEHNLVSAVSNSGGFGVIASGALSAKGLEKEILETFRLTNRNFGVNLIVMRRDLDTLVDVCSSCGVKYIVLSGGIPKAGTITKIKQAGIKVICLTPSLPIAKRLFAFGVDAMVVEGSEAGGHIGSVTTSILVQEVVSKLKDEIFFVAGGIGSGSIVASYMYSGACGCQMGTKFVCAEESLAHSNFKELFVKSSSRDTVVSPQLSSDFPVIPVRYIKNKAHEDFVKFQSDIINLHRSGEINKSDGQYEIEKFWAGSLKRSVIDGDVVNGSVMAGQSVGMVSSIQSTKEIIMGIVKEVELYFDYEPAH